MRRRLFSIASTLGVLVFLAACAAPAERFDDRHPGAKRANTYGCPCR